MKKAKAEKEEKKVMKTYRAIKKGFDGVKVREIGEVFVSDIPEGSWMEEVEGADKKAVLKKHKELAEAGADHDSEFSQNDANAKAAQLHKEPDVI